MHDDDDDDFEEDDFEEDDLEEDPSEDDVDDSDEAETIRCPHCGQHVYENAEQCPWCGKYLSRPANRSKIPWWIVVGAVLALVSMIAWFW